MLVVTRRIGEEIMLPDCGVTIAVVSVAGSKVKLGVTAPAGVPVHRSEVLEDARGAGCRNCPDLADGSSNLASAGTGCESAAAPLASTATQDMERELTVAITRRTGGKSEVAKGPDPWRPNCRTWAHELLLRRRDG